MVIFLEIRFPHHFKLTYRIWLHVFLKDRDHVIIVKSAVYLSADLTPTRWPTMTILDNAEQDLLQLWALIAELGDDLSQSRNLAVSLHAQAGSIKVDSSRSLV
jgi:hypothetical protein